MNLFELLVYTLLFSLLIGCADSPYSNVMKSNSKDFEQNSGYVDIFFDDLEPKYEYEQIGLVEYVEDETVNEKFMFNRFKYEAWKQGADAIIRVKKEQRHREYYEPFKKGHDKKERYVTAAFTGIAVKYIVTESNKAELTARSTDSTMFKTLQREQELETEGGVFLIMLLSIIAIGGGIFMLSADKSLN